MPGAAVARSVGAGRPRGQGAHGEGGRAKEGRGGAAAARLAGRHPHHSTPTRVPPRPSCRRYRPRRGQASPSGASRRRRRGGELGDVLPPRATPPRAVAAPRPRTRPHRPWSRSTPSAAPPRSSASRESGRQRKRTIRKKKRTSRARSSLRGDSLSNFWHLRV